LLGMPWGTWARRDEDLFIENAKIMTKIFANTTQMVFK
jgi:hypothetical protein